jgi:hypothetical protein
LAWIGVANNQYAVVKTGMRSQNFPVCEADLIAEIAVYDLHVRVQDILSGTAAVTSEETLKRELTEYQQQYKLSASFA